MCNKIDNETIFSDHLCLAPQFRVHGPLGIRHPLWMWDENRRKSNGVDD